MKKCAPSGVEALQEAYEIRYDWIRRRLQIASRKESDRYLGNSVSGLSRLRGLQTAPKLVGLVKNIHK